MPENNSKIAQITEKLEQSVKEVFTSEKYSEYLKFMSNFHRYSPKNQILIFIQKPNAKFCAGFKTWQNLGRQVKRGEKGIQIVAPAAIKEQKETPKLDPDTKQQLYDENGKPIFEKSEVFIPKFTTAYVFDISQTDGAKLPELTKDIAGNVRDYEKFLKILKQISPLKIEFAPLENADGKCIFGDKIIVRENMSEPQTIVALIHEIAHAKLHDTSNLEVGETPKDTRTIEVEAKSIAYSVCQYFGVETGENGFSYIASWSSNRDIKELKSSLEIINKTSKDLNEEIEAKFKEITKEHETEKIEQVEKIKPVAELAEPEISHKIRLPDTITLEERNAYGYKYDGFLPILREKAEQLFESGLTVATLHQDGKEDIILESEEIFKHSGIFGVATDEWKKYLRDIEAQKSNETSKPEIKLNEKQSEIKKTEIVKSSKTISKKMQTKNTEKIKHEKMSLLERLNLNKKKIAAQTAEKNSSKNNQEV